MKEIALYLGTSILLLIVGFPLWHLFNNVSMIQLAGANIELVHYKMTTQFVNNITFAFSLSIIPLIIYALKKFKLNTNYLQDSLITVIAILFSALILWQIRLYTITSNENYPNLIAVEELRLEIYFLIGIILGAVFFSIFKFVKQNKKRANIV